MNLQQRVEQAAYRRTAPSELERLAADHNVVVRWQVARNPAIPAAVLDRLLAADADLAVRLAAKAAAARRRA